MDPPLCARTPIWTDSSSSARKESWTSRYLLPPTSSTAWRSEKALNPFSITVTEMKTSASAEQSYSCQTGFDLLSSFWCIFPSPLPPFLTCPSHPTPSPRPPLLVYFILLQGLLSMERIPVIIRFLPVLFNQLFKVLTQNDNDEVTTATTR